MVTIQSSLLQFTQALLLNKPVVVNDKGEWGVQNVWAKCFQQAFRREAPRLVQISQVFSAILDDLESIPVQFSDSPYTGQLVDFKGYLRAAEAIAAQLSVLDAPYVAEARRQLELRMAALKYRLESVNGGLNAQAPCNHLSSRLQEKAIEWKHTLEIVFDKSLNEDELLAIEEICRYPAYAELLLQNHAECTAFFEWSLRDKISPAIFVQYPALTRKLVACSLNGRIGRMGGSTVLKLAKTPVENGSIQKIITLPFEGVDISILDDKRVIEFRGGYSLILSEVYQIFHDKYFKVGNLEFMAEGIINWNIHKWGWWNAAASKYEIVDLTRSGWWKQLPLFETLTLQGAKDRYGSDADGESWLASATATRGRASLDVELTHAYLELAIPMGEGNYAIFDFGKLANQYPATYVDMLKMVCQTVHATIGYPDENVFYTHRQHAQHTFKLTPAQGMQLMDSIKRDMISSRGLNFVYQIESENCAKWVHEKIESAIGAHAIPNMFVMSIFHTEALSVLGSIINFCKIFPEPLRIKALTFFHLPLGASQGHWVLEHGCIVWRALTHHSFWKTGTIYLPCFLHRQKELGHLYQPLSEKKLKNISDEPDELIRIPRVLPSSGEKTAIQPVHGVQALKKIVSHLTSMAYGFSPPLLNSLRLPWGKILTSQVALSPGTQFALLKL